ncbi:DNA-directed RNA polymerase specialized sigma24 family protein [Streptomyces albogriseolus]
MSSGAPAHNASVHNQGHGATDPASAGHHGPMRDDEAGTAHGAIGALVHRAVDGDEQATHDLLAHVHPLALRYCRTRLSRLPGDARHFVEDLAQEVCVAVLLALPRYKDTGRPFEAFIFAIASHKVADLQRAAMRHPGSTAVPSDEMPERPDDSLGPGGARPAQQRRRVGQETAGQPAREPARADPPAHRRGAHRGGDRPDVGNVTRRGPGGAAPRAEPAAGPGGAVTPVPAPPLRERDSASVAYERTISRSRTNLRSRGPCGTVE